MTLQNMRVQGERALAAYCLNSRCLHRARLDVEQFALGADKRQQLLAVNKSDGF